VKTTLRAHLEAAYERIGRIAIPVWLVTWLAFFVLLRAPLEGWAFGVAGVVFAAYLLAVGQIPCPRCHKRIGVGSQVQPGGGRGRMKQPLRDISCPHCGLTLDEPVR
jgi:hypothetical protein